MSWHMNSVVLKWVWNYTFLTSIQVVQRLNMLSQSSSLLKLCDSGELQSKISFKNVRLRLSKVWEAVGAQTRQTDQGDSLFPQVFLCYLGIYTGPAPELTARLLASPRFMFPLVPDDSIERKHCYVQVMIVGYWKFPFASKITSSAFD